MRFQQERLGRDVDLWISFVKVVDGVQGMVFDVPAESGHAAAYI